MALHRLDQRGRRARMLKRGRHFVIGVLVVLFSIVLPLSVTLGWVRTSIVNTSGWVRTVGGIPSEPAVASALGTELTNQVFSALQVQQQVASALPPKASYLAGPITNGVEGYVRQGMTKTIQSPQFESLWVQANKFAHAQLVAVLEGKSNAVTTTNGQVVLNLVPLLNAGLTQLEGVISGIVGRPVNLPTLNPNDVPASACEKIGAALGVALPSNCAQVPLFPADKLTRAQDLVRRLHNGVTALFIITPILAALTIWISDRRRRTSLQLLGGSIIGLVVFRRALIWLREALVSSGKPENKAARQAILSHLLHGFFLATTWFLVGFALAALVLALTGPYGWARATRREAVKASVTAWGAARALGGKATSPATTDWLANHVVWMQVAGAAVGILLILALPISWVGTLIILVLLGIFEALMERFKRQTGGGVPAPAGGPAPPRRDSTNSV